MKETGIKGQNDSVEDLGLQDAPMINWNLPAAALIENAIKNGEGQLCENGALAADTGKFTGRSPKDRFIVEDDITRDSVWWGDINIKFSPDKFHHLYNKVIHYLQNKELFVRNAYACADKSHQLKLRVITETAFQNLFARNLFLKPTGEEIDRFQPDWTIIAASDFEANPEEDGTRQSNFAIINFSRKMILIGGTGYTGEIKKGVFSILNFILPQYKNVLSMHSSANMGKTGDTAIFFGLSGTGKTTLSADPRRQLIGDDEHGWNESGIFNFEGGCYAKVIDLSPEKEPQIYNAIRYGSLLENTEFYPGTRQVNFHNTEKTENTRAAYPIHFINNARVPSVGGIPENIFLLTCDAFGVIPPISRLDKGQAMYHFISGYTAKVAGTEADVDEPQPVFSACYGAPFLPLHPTRYAEMLGEKMEQHDVNVWLVNTGWTGGPYGVGNRIELTYTRALIHAALEGKLQDVEYKTNPTFGLKMPRQCRGVPSEILDPRSTWENKNAYDQKARELADYFNKNFEKYESYAKKEIKEAAPALV